MNLAKPGTIISVKHIAHRTIELTIKVPEDFVFLAGQYIWLMIPELIYPDPRGNTRMFSIVSSPNRKSELSLVFRTSNSGYKRTVLEMSPGAEVVFSGPYGHLVLPEMDTQPLVMIAGGVGLAPFLSIVRYLTETNSYHTVSLIYVNTRQSEAAYLNELTQIEKNNPHFKFISIFGVLKKRQIQKLINVYVKQNVTWAVSGPRGFVDFVGNCLHDQGVSMNNIAFEEFYPHLSKK